MIKKLLTGIAVFSAVLSFSQNGRSVKDEGVKVTFNGFNDAYNAKTAALYCDTLYNFNLSSPTTTMTIYTLNTNTACTTGGYLVGNNCYGDAQKAAFFAGSQYSALTSPSVTGCFVFFWKSTTSTRGTKGVATNTMGLNIYSGSLAGGPTGASLGTSMATMGSITSVFSSTSSLGSYYFNYATPVSVTGSGFFTSAVLPKVLGDTAVIFQQFSAATSSGWEMDNTSTWYDMNANWGLKCELCMFPVMGCSSVTGLNEKELSNFFKVVPNPSNGVFSLVSLLSNLSYDISVVNMLGQEIMSKKNINGAAVNDINLSNYNNGVYFVNITSGNNTITKKLVLNK